MRIKDDRTSDLWATSPVNDDPAYRATLGLPDEIGLTDITLREGRQLPGLSLGLPALVAYAARARNLGILDLEIFNRPAEIEALAGVEGVRPQVLIPPPMVLDAENDEALASYVASGAAVLSMVTFAVTPQNRRLVSTIVGGEVDQAAITRDVARTVTKVVGLDVPASVLILDFLRADPADLHHAIDGALDAGASVIRLDDLCAPAPPSVYAKVVGDVRARYPDTRIAIHSHNDLGLAVATQLASLEGGADILEGSTLGLGEKAGVADLACLLPSLEMFYGYDTGIDLGGLHDLSHFVADAWNYPLRFSDPAIGTSAFSSAAEVHYLPGTETFTFNCWDPEVVGNQVAVPISEVLGPHALRQKLAEIGVDPQPERVVTALVPMVHDEMRLRRGAPSDDVLRGLVARAVEAAG